MAQFSPLGAVVRGAIAGAAGSFVLGLFFKATSKIAPTPPEGAFAPPEPEQKGEQATETVARRVAHKLMQRGPLTDDEKKQAGELVHVGFGAAWGGLYGLVHGSSPVLRGPLGMLGFSALVWGVSDNVILPAFRLAGPPQNYPAQHHAYALAAHVVYGATVWAAFEALTRATWTGMLAVAGARWATRNLPAPVRPAASRALATARSMRAGKRVERAIEGALRQA